MSSHIAKIRSEIKENRTYLIRKHAKGMRERILNTLHNAQQKTLLNFQVEIFLF